MNQGVAVHALRNLDVDLDELKRTIEARLEKGKGPAVGLFAPNAKAKRILELAHAVAQQLNHGWIGTEHLLLALIRAEDTIPSRCLLESAWTSIKRNRKWWASSRATTPQLTRRNRPTNPTKCSRGAHEAIRVKPPRSTISPAT
jgi:ATP-dependent Clp protease ATP-binding subunit ClpA